MNKFILNEEWMHGHLKIEPFLGAIGGHIVDFAGNKVRIQINLPGKEVIEPIHNMKTTHDLVITDARTRDRKSTKKK
jgi:hypothetical protein